MKRIGSYVRIALGIYCNRPVAGPYTVQLGLSDACNYKCIMCNVFSESSNSPYHTGKERLMDFGKAVSLIRDLSEIGTQHIHICGFGESLLYPRIQEIVALVKQLKMKIYITTNGYFLDRELIDSLRKTGLDGLYISLDAATALTYAAIHIGSKPGDFNRVIENISYATNATQVNKKKMSIVLSFVLMSINYKEIESFFQLAQKLNIDEIIFREVGTAFLRDKMLILDSAAKDYIRKTQAAIRQKVNNNLSSVCHSFNSEQKRGVACFAGYIGGALITADGAVFPCCNCNTPIGNISQTTFGSIWRSPAYQDFRYTGKLMWRHESYYPRSCLCDTCPTHSLNKRVQTILYPWKRT